MRQVFISYSSKEARQANEIVDALEKQGIECWIAPRNIRVGSNYTKDIPSAIRECPCFLLVLSRNSQDSKWVNKELTRAINQDKRIMPLLIEDFSVSEGFEFLLEDVQTRPYYQTKEQTMREVLEEIRVLMPERAQPPAQKENRSVPSGPVHDLEIKQEPIYNPESEKKNIDTPESEQVPSAPRSLNLSAERIYQAGEIAYFSNNYVSAFAMYKKAAEQGHSKAQYKLGYCYQYSQGTKRDMVEAQKWYEKAADQGEKNAKNALVRLLYLQKSWKRQQ